MDKYTKFILTIIPTAIIVKLTEIANNKYSYKKCYKS